MPNPSKKLLADASDLPSKVDVRIRGDHPHTGKIGWIPMQNGKPETINVLGCLMARVEFPDGTGCFAEQRHLCLGKFDVSE